MLNITEQVERRVLFRGLGIVLKCHLIDTPHRETPNHVFNTLTVPSTCFPCRENDQLGLQSPKAKDSRPCLGDWYW